MVCCAGLFLLLGMLPLSSRPAGARGALGAVLIVADLCLLVLVAWSALQRGLENAHWPWIVVIAGLSLLVAPFLLQPVPQTVRDGRAGLSVLLVLLLFTLVA